MYRKLEILGDEERQDLRFRVFGNLFMMIKASQISSGVIGVVQSGFIETETV